MTKTTPGRFRAPLAFVAVITLMLFCVPAPVPAAASLATLSAEAQPAQAAQPAPDGFEPVTSVPVQEQLPAAPLVMLAYAVVWVVVLFYLWSLWRRLGTVERELADVTRRIGEGRRS